MRIDDADILNSTLGTPTNRPGYAFTYGNNGILTLQMESNGQWNMGQTAHNGKLTNVSNYLSDRTASTGNTRQVLEAGVGQSTDLWAAYAYNATPMAGTKYLSVDASGFLNTQFSTPASSSEACTQGRLKFDADYIYVCTATNTWKRATLDTF
jgi:hypothetical protein